MSNEPHKDRAHPQANSQSVDDLYFRATLTPHRSLGPVGFGVLMGAIGLVSFVAGMFFWWIGAAPVMGFFGLDFLIIYIGFKLNYRAADVREVLEIVDGQLSLVRTSPNGSQTHWQTNAYWARIGVVEAPNKPTIMQLTSHGRSYAFGDFLGEEEKFEFAEELRGVLETYREGGIAPLAH